MDKPKAAAESTRARLEVDCPHYPPQAIRAYQRAGYWRGDTIPQVFAALSQTYDARIALLEGDRQLSYRDLAQRVTRLARGLSELGLVSGDVAVVQLPNRMSFVETVLAMVQIGVVPVMALPAHRATEIGQFCAFTRARAYVTADVHGGFDFRELAAQIQCDLPDPLHILIDGIPGTDQTALRDLYCDGPDLAAPLLRPDDVAIFQISGGTTGIPKLIPRRHQEYLYNMRIAARASGIDETTVFLCALPIAHNFPFACPGIMGTLLSGGRVVLSDDPDPHSNFALITRHDVTLTSVVPPMLIAWNAAAALGQLRTLDRIQVGGARLAETVALQISETLGCALQQVYGMAEGLICFTDTHDMSHRVCAGQTYPMSPGDTLRVVSADDGKTPVPTGTAGLLQVRGPYTMCGYYRAPEKNVESFTKDGFYITGDLVVQASDGAVQVVGRLKEQINRGGEKLSGEELENTLIRHPDVQDAAVVGRADAILGERIHAFVIATSGELRPLALKRFLRDEGVATFKMPDQITMLDRFPETGVGKINKTVLRQLLRDETPQSTTKEPV